MTTPNFDADVVREIASEVEGQITNAIELINRPASDYLAWPFAALDRNVGRLPPGSLSYVVAFSGTGKSTFSTSAIDRWLTGGRRIFHMPLETQAHEWRVRWACHRLGYNSGDVMGGVLQQRPDWMEIRATIAAEVRAHALGAMKEMGLWVSPVQHVTAAGLADAMDDAAAWQADVVIIDHIDHIEGDDAGRGLYEESVRVNKRLLKLAQQYNLRVVATSQANLNGTKADRLSKYAMPQVGDILMGGHKKDNATQVLGLFRPLRPRDPFSEPEPRIKGEPDKYAEALSAARKGLVEPWTMLKPETMGVGTIKLRNQGKNLDASHRHEGACIELAVVNGRVEDQAEKDTYQTTRFRSESA